LRSPSAGREPANERISALARGIVEAMPMTLHELEAARFLVLDGDIAHSLGALLKEEWGIASDVLVIDGVVALGLRLRRPGARAHALAHGAGDHQVARVQRGPARPALRSHASSRRPRPRARAGHTTITTRTEADP
jgi:ethanolamine utilization protein EutA